MGVPRLLICFWRGQTNKHTNNGHCDLKTESASGLIKWDKKKVHILRGRNRTSWKSPFIQFWCKCYLKKIQTIYNIDVKSYWLFFSNGLKRLLSYFIPVSGPAQLIQTRPGKSFSGLSLPSRPDSLFLLTSPIQDHGSLSAPSLDCLCKAGANSWSGVLK